ncbi:MAG: glycosyltransferase family 39 protein [Arenimonas sp.]
MKFYLLWSLMLALKLLLAWQLQLFGDEAFYAWEATKPAWAYSDLPGMTAWLIRFGIEVGGYSAFSARLAFVAMGALIPFFIIRIATRFSTAAHGWQAGILSCCLPVLLPVGVLALPEAPLCLAVLLCLDAAMGLQEKCSSIVCLELALGLMMGAMTHYRFLIILLAGGLGVVLSGAWRQYRDPKVLLAVLIGACAWLPLVFYNQQHEFAGWQFQFHDRNPWHFSAGGLAHLPIQAIITTPILYVALLWCLWSVFLSWYRGEKKMGMILGVAGLSLILFASLAFFADQIRTSFHWPLPAYFPLIAALPIFLADKFPESYKKLFSLIVFTGLAGVIVGLTYLLTAILPGMAGALAGKKSYPDNFVGWNEISIATNSLLKENEIVVADNFMLAAELQFSLPREKMIYVLDHPLNYKHGRAKQLHDWELDSEALSRLNKNSPGLIVIEETSTKQWLRDQWRTKLCTQFNGLKFEKTIYGPGKGKSFSIFRGRLGADPKQLCDTRIKP